MSNEIKSGNMSEQSGKNDPNRTAPKSGQQSQGASQKDQKDNEGTKHAGSTNMASDPKKSNEAGNKGAASK